VSRRALLVVGLLVCVLIAGGLSYYASGDPDGLNKVASDEGFAEGEKSHALEDSPFAGYETKGVDNDRLSGGLAGVVGVGVTFLLVGGLVYAVRRGKGRDDERSADRDASGARR
jgi:hypothetical protein